MKLCLNINKYIINEKVRLKSKNIYKLIINS